MTPFLGKGSNEKLADTHSFVCIKVVGFSQKSFHEKIKLAAHYFSISEIFSGAIFGGSQKLITGVKVVMEDLSETKTVARFEHKQLSTILVFYSSALDVCNTRETSKEPCTEMHVRQQQKGVDIERAESLFLP